MDEQVEVVLYRRHSMVMGVYCTPTEVTNLLQLPGIEPTILGSAVCCLSLGLHVIPATRRINYFNWLINIYISTLYLLPNEVNTLETVIQLNLFLFLRAASCCICRYWLFRVPSIATNTLKKYISCDWRNHKKSLIFFIVGPAALFNALRNLILRADNKWHKDGCWRVSI
jgi:hypothetical protein